MILTDWQKNRYKIMSRKNCERYCRQKHKESSVIISIKSTWDKIAPDIYINDYNNVKDILFLTFDDDDFEENPKYCMQFSDGKKVAEFVNNYYKKVRHIIIHCDGGVSRSAGVCAAIMRVKEGEDCFIFNKKTKHPNMTCYLRTLKGFGYI